MALVQQAAVAEVDIALMLNPSLANKAEVRQPQAKLAK